MPVQDSQLESIVLWKNLVEMLKSARQIYVDKRSICSAFNETPVLVTTSTPKEESLPFIVQSKCYHLAS